MRPGATNVGVPHHMLLMLMGKGTWRDSAVMVCMHACAVRGWQTQCTYAAEQAATWETNAPAAACMHMLDIQQLQSRVWLLLCIQMQFKQLHC